MTPSDPKTAWGKHRMSDNKKGKKGKGGKGGFGKTLMVLALLLGGGGAAFWFLAPEQAQAQLAHLRQLLGL
ncbi:MAG: hypothetical protein KDE27_19790 [Planctomycetes bacterium]|nr:hypothetical protein [Planctomycetota bacterium]